MSTRRKMAVLLFSLVVIGGGWALADLVEKVPLRIIADTDTPVPGQEGGTFQTFFQVNGLDPDISGRNVVFTACCPGGVYGWFDGELRVIANLDSTFPGTDNPLGFDFTSPSISGENVAFSCRNGRPGPGAICAYINGELESIALSGVTRVPGSAETFGSLFMLNGVGPSISGENVVFAASSDSFNGIYARINGELVTIADNNTPVPGGTGTFMNFEQLFGASPTISGSNVAFVGECAEGAGVYAYINGELRVIADTNTPVPGGSGNFVNPVSTGGSRPLIDGENIAFVATFPSGIFAYIDGELRMIADTDTPAPGATGKFFNFGRLDGHNPRISGENVAFWAKGVGLGAGIFVYIDGELELIAGENTPVPGHDPTTFVTFGDGVSPAISGKNVVFFGNANVAFEHSVGGIYGRIVEMPIPTVSRWSLIVLTLLLLSVGIVMVRRRCEAACSGGES